MTTATSTKALKLTFSGIELQEVPLEPLKPSEMLVRIRAIAFNPLDVVLQPFSAIKTLYAGKDLAGVVEEVGPEAAKIYSVGDEICGVSSPFKSVIGTYAVLDAHSAITKKPDYMSFTEAAAFPATFGTAFCMMRSAEVQPSSKILVVGAGTCVGSFLLQLLRKHCNVQNIVVTCSAGSSEGALAYGASECIDYKSCNVSDELQKRAADAKFDVIFDTVGGYDVYAIADKILRPLNEGSKYLTVVGDYPPGRNYRWHSLWILLSAPFIKFREQFPNVVGVNYKFVEFGRAPWIKEASEILNEHKFKVPIDTVYPLEEYKTAFDRVARVQARGKVVLEC